MKLIPMTKEEYSKESSNSQRNDYIYINYYDLEKKVGPATDLNTGDNYDFIEDGSKSSCCWGFYLDKKRRDNCILLWDKYNLPIIDDDFSEVDKFSVFGTYEMIQKFKRYLEL